MNEEKNREPYSNVVKKPEILISKDDHVKKSSKAFRDADVTFKEGTREVDENCPAYKRGEITNVKDPNSDSKKVSRKCPAYI